MKWLWAGRMEKRVELDIPDLGECFTWQIRLQHERNSYVAFDVAAPVRIESIEDIIRDGLFGGSNVPVRCMSILLHHLRTEGQNLVAHSRSGLYGR
jgi:hypothetical protein